jgi:hypothetical protein
MSTTREMTGGQFLGILFLRSLLALAIAIALVYAVDAALLRFRAATNRNAFATVTVHPYFAVDRKDKKTEFLYQDPQDETCVNSLFPHLGHSPCWYLRRHTDESLPN